MDKCEPNVVGLSEVWWPGKGEMCRETIKCSTQLELKLKKVLQVLGNDIVKHLTKGEFYSDRLIFMKISAKSDDIVLVKVYMPITNHDDDEIIKTVQ